MGAAPQTTTHTAMPAAAGDNVIVAEKASIEYIVEADEKQPYHKGVIPESLAGKSPEELLALRKSLVRKIDFRLLPMLILLFLLK